MNSPGKYLMYHVGKQTTPYYQCCSIAHISRSPGPWPKRFWFECVSEATFQEMSNVFGHDFIVSVIRWKTAAPAAENYVAVKTGEKKGPAKKVNHVDVSEIVSVSALLEKRKPGRKERTHPSRKETSSSWKLRNRSRRPRR